MIHPSPYFNPFQAFVEREKGHHDPTEPRSAIENNMCRAVFAALANTNLPRVLGDFLVALTDIDSPVALRLRKVADFIRTCNDGDIQLDMQSWPPVESAAMAKLEVILIGISSSHFREWTHDSRVASSKPCADAWIYVPGKALLVFECKNDECGLDATQISTYAYALGLLQEGDCPRAAPNTTLASPEEARLVQQACQGILLDLDWSRVHSALRLASQPEAETIGSWLCARACEYLEWHISPPYTGVQSIIDWLQGPDTEDRRGHLRTLVRRLGDTLEKAANDPDAVTFSKDKGENWELMPGAASAVYTRLAQHGHTMEMEWLGRKVHPVLWFNFSEHREERIGLEYYIQAAGCHTNKNTARDWNAASDRHQQCANEFEDAFERWANGASGDLRVLVTAVRFNGKKRNWQGGGIEEAIENRSILLPPLEAFQFLKNNRERLWRFPKCGHSEEFATIEEAALGVRKPAVSIIAKLPVDSLIECSQDACSLQHVLQAALASLSK